LASSIARDRFAGAVVGERNRPAEQLTQSLGDGTQAELRRRLALRSAEMAL
jgi:hypothetical protein